MKIDFNKFNYKYIVFIIYSRIKDLITKKFKNNSRLIEMLMLMEIWFFKITYNNKSEKVTKEILDNKRLKIGLIGRFSGLLGFPRELFENLPDNIDLYLYDLGFNNVYCKDYSKLSTYRELKLPDSLFNKDEYKQLTNTIDKDDLDSCVIVNDGKSYVYLLVDLLKTANLVSINTGSFPLFNKKCILQSYVQFQCGYTVDDNKIINTVTNKKIEPFIVDKELFYYDKRDISLMDVEKDKSNIILFTGSLFKLKNKVFLKIISDILDEVKDSEFYFYGKNTFGGLEEIEEFFSTRKQKERIKYCGVYSVARDKDGNLQDSSWDDAVKIMRKAKVYVDAFPYTGGSTLIEAYGLGLPVVQIIDDNNCEFRGEDIRILRSDSGSANGTEDYKTLVVKILEDDSEVVQTIINEQNEIFNKLTNPANFWNRLVGLLLSKANK